MQQLKLGSGTRTLAFSNRKSECHYENGLISLRLFYLQKVLVKQLKRNYLLQGQVYYKICYVDYIEKV